MATQTLVWTRAPTDSTVADEPQGWTASDGQCAVAVGVTFHHWQVSRSDPAAALPHAGAEQRLLTAYAIKADPTFLDGNDDGLRSVTDPELAHDG